MIVSYNMNGKHYKVHPGVKYLWNIPRNKHYLKRKLLSEDLHKRYTRLTKNKKLENKYKKVAKNHV